MKLEVFFEKFDLFVDTAESVGELRKVILRLAVQGSLVKQSNKDEPASELLRRLNSRLFFTDAARLPTGWACVALGGLLALQKGKKPDNLNTAGVGLPYLDIAALERGELRQFTDDSNCPRASTEDLVIVCDGSRSGLVLDGLRGVLGSTVSKIRYAGFTRNYLKLFLQSLYDNLNGAKKGAAIPHLNIPRLLSLPAPIPPLAEQTRIVTRVGELMALCDGLESKQQEREARHATLARASLARFAEAPNTANLQFLFHKSYEISPVDLRKSILALAIQGKLVSQDSTDESIEKLLDESKAFEDRNGKKRKWAGSIEDEEKPFQLPPSWKWLRLGDVSSLKHGYAFSSKYFTSEPSRFVLTTPGNFHEKGGFRDRASKRKYYSGPVDPEFIFKPGDLIIPMTEQAAGLLGSPAFIPDDGRTYIHNQRLGKFSFSEFIAPEFAFWFFNGEFFRGELARTCTGMKVRHTSPDRVLRVPFPVCPIAEQRRIVAKVDELMALVDALEMQLTTARATAAKLMEAVVAEFSAAAERWGQVLY